MKITCPSCSARYAIPDEKIAGKVAKIRCRKCGAGVKADGRTDPPGVSLAEAEEHAPIPPTDAAPVRAPLPPGHYSVDLSESDQREMPLAELLEAYNTGLVTAETYIWTEGMSDWTPLGEVTEVVDALHAAADAEPAPEEAEPSAGEPRRPAAPEELAAQDESSILFSLEALTSSHAHSVPSAPGVKDTSEEDSGLIDLQALTSQTTAAAPSSVTAPVVAPVDAVRPAFATEHENKPKRGLIFGLAAAVIVALVLVGGFVMNQRAEAEEARLRAEETAAKEIAAAQARAEAAEANAKRIAAERAKAEADAQRLAEAKAAEAKLEAEARAKAEAEAEEAKKPTRKASNRTKSRPRRSKPAAKPATAPKAKKPAPKPSSKRGKCGCAAGDLQCAIRCAAGG